MNLLTKTCRSYRVLASHDFQNKNFAIYQVQENFLNQE